MTRVLTQFLRNVANSAFLFSFIQANPVHFLIRTTVFNERWLELKMFSQDVPDHLINSPHGKKVMQEQQNLFAKHPKT